MLEESVVSAPNHTLVFLMKMNEPIQKESARDVLDFLLDFSTTLIMAGAQSSRTLRNVFRFSETFGYTVHTIILPRTIIMTIDDMASGCDRKTITEVRKIPHGTINFTSISELRRLSWEACTKEMSLAECRSRYEKIKELPRISGLPLIFTVSLGNAALCQLFGGWYSIPLVFVGTFLGFSLRCYLLSRRVPALIVFFLSAFAASFSTALAAELLELKTNIALSTSVLFLVPGIPLLMSVVDIIEGHTISGVSRFVNAMLVILALTMGLVLTVVILGIDL